jgi:hypothetical protein
MSHIWTGLALAVSIQLGVHASQSQPSTQQPANSTVSSATVTVTGCLQPGTAAATGSPTAPDAPTASPGPAHFVLMQPATPATAADSPAASGAPSGRGGVAAPPAAVGTSGSVVRVSHYILHGRDGELAKHVGQRVEIVGTSSQAAPDDTTAAAAAGAGTQVIPHEPQHGAISTLAPGSAGTPEATAHPSVQHLTVQSVRTLAATCS